MNSTTQMGQLLGFVGVLAGESARDPILEAALPVLLEIAAADAAVVLRPSAEGLRPVTSAGLALDVEEWQATQAGTSASLMDHPVPSTWQTEGITRVASHPLPGIAGTLVLAWTAQPADTAALELALTTLDGRLAHAQCEERLADLTARMDNAQSLANMGDYDWHIPSDTNTWSDQLFRIYGHEPQSFHPTYEKFLSLIHTEDRDWISALHQKAYATGEPYTMIERIVRPTGEVRFLSSNGEVIMDENSQPVRMRGTCVDITDRVRADRERERIAARFQGLVDSAPDAILVLGADQRVLEANQMAYELLGGDPRGHRIQDLLPEWPTNDATDVPARSLDGRGLRLDVITVGVTPASDAAVNDAQSDGDSLVALFLRDAGPRLDGEALAARLSESQLRRRQALEINDNVVQGLVAAVYALHQGQVEVSRSYLDRTLSSARAMMDDLLDPLDGVGLQPGDLVRTAAAVIGTDTATAEDQPAQVMELRRSHSVLVVDDAEDLRVLLRVRMENHNGLTVVGEAADGVAAVELASELQPDLVLLDLAMPRMDGLEALPLIRAAVPGVRVIVLSGFNESTMAQKALEAGADHYVVKGGSMKRLLELVDSLLQPAS
jgi:PAS domain S-box-containing protein